MTNAEPLMSTLTIDATKLRKVTATKDGTTHVKHPTRGNHTLCGRHWWFECESGTDLDCRKCQHILNKETS